jgi:hypothetical protein
MQSYRATWELFELTDWRARLDACDEGAAAIVGVALIAVLALAIGTRMLIDRLTPLPDPAELRARPLLGAAEADRPIVAHGRLTNG